MQQPPTADQRPSLLADFVRRRDQRALNTYLLILAVNSSGDNSDGWSTTEYAATWARACGMTSAAELKSATSAFSKTLRRLRERKLITSQKVGRSRKVQVGLLREDGSGDPYSRPGKDGQARAGKDTYLKLPNSYWLQRWNERLSLPGLAMLLVALHAKDSFELPTERVPEWYGWSADTAERGFAELIRLRVLTKATRLAKAPLSPTGLTAVNTYTLDRSWRSGPGTSANRPRSELAG